MNNLSKKCTPQYPSLKNVKLGHDFFGNWMHMIRTVSVKDILSKFMSDGILIDYERVALRKTGECSGLPWHHGLTCECIRGISDLIAQEYDPELDAELDRIIAEIEKAQAADPDGYINPYTTLLRPQKRWGKNGGNLIWQHETYNAGCLAEAGVHHYLATGKTALLQVAVRMCNYLADFIGDAPKHNVVAEHSLPEKAFLKMYRLFADNPALETALNANASEYLRLARYFVDHKGDNETRYSEPKFMREYSQDHRLAREQFEAVGHAVRATLFYEGMAALALEDNDEALEKAARAIWKDIACSKQHANGSVGAIKNEERFGLPYELPNDTYLETCAGVGLMFFGTEMFKLTADASVWDTIETTLYNMIPASVSADGVKYTYQNPLISKGDFNRWKWHPCPCCPPMLLKFVGILPTLIFAESGKNVWLNLHIAGTLTRSDCTLTFDGKKLTVNTENGSVPLTLRIRLPYWARNFSITLNGKPHTFTTENGYAVIDAAFANGDTVALTYDMPIVKYIAHPYVEEDRTRIIVKHGPFLYCAEAIDNAPAESFDTFDFTVSADAPLTMDTEQNILGTCEDGTPFKLVPYYKWNNRGAGYMRIWLKQAGYVADCMNTEGWADVLYRPYAEYTV